MSARKTTRRRARKPLTGRRWGLPLAAAAVVGALGLWFFAGDGASAAQETSAYGYEILDRHPHDSSAYTQGLYFEDGVLFEGTGRRGRSFLREVGIESGAVTREVALPPTFFGEGIATLDTRIFQLTWTSGVGFIYDKGTFRQLGSFRYPGEGWGLTTDGEFLIMSDGTAEIRFLDPESFAEVRRIEVRDADGPVTNLNELEYVDGGIFANIWFSNSIVEIDPESGTVRRSIDFTPLYDEVRPRETDAVLNGIAFDSAQDRFFITGKLWPTMFEVRLDP